MRTVAAGSTLLIKVTGAADAPVLITPEGGSRPPQSGRPRRPSKVRAPLADSGRYQLSDGAKLLAEWRFTLRPDAPPTMVAMAPPRATARHGTWRSPTGPATTLRRHRFSVGASPYRRDGADDDAPPLEITWHSCPAMIIAAWTGSAALI